MDVTINSQVQSPLVRTLESVSTKAGSFTHNIPDNIPPLSMTKVRVQPYTMPGSWATADQKVEFQIPQCGYLHKAVLKFKYAKAATPTAGAGGPAAPPAANTATVSGMRFPLVNHCAYATVDRMQLASRNRAIEHLFGTDLWIRALNSDAGNRSRLLNMSQPRAIYTSGDETRLSEPGRAGDGGDAQPFYWNLLEYGHTPDSAGNHAVSDQAVAYLDVPLSSFESLAHSYNTRFVEPLVLQTWINPPTQYNVVPAANAADPTRCANLNGVELICYFINYHDVTDQDIRNADFNPEVPAVVMQHDCYLEQEFDIINSGVKVGQGDLTNAGYIVNCSIRLRANQLAYAVGVAVVNNAPSVEGYDYLCQVPLAGAAHTDCYNNAANVLAARRNDYLPKIMGMSLTGSGQTLYESVDFENELCDRFAYNLSTLEPKATGPISDVSTTPVISPLDRSFTATTGLIHFGLSNNKTYNSGAIGLQTITNPTLNVTVALPNDFAGWGTYADAAHGRPTPMLHVYVYHHALVQIDSGTGAITRSIDA